MAKVSLVRWDDLFADLERQWDALAEGERQAQIAERTRAELARVELLDRLRGSEGRPVRLLTRAGHELSGELVRAGADFVLVESSRHECVVPVEAVMTVRGLAGTAVSADVAGAVRSRLGLRSVLRRIAADRSAVTLETADGRAVAGTLQRVGADFVDVVEHPPDELPRGATGRDGVTVPFAAIVLLRRDRPEAPF
jgi:small nuclear ribonucleoprotein (snRNP)-like protein